MNTVKVQPDGLSWALERASGAIGQATSTWRVLPPAGSYVLMCHVGRPHSTVGSAGLYTLLVQQEAQLGATGTGADLIELAFETYTSGVNNLVAGPVAVVTDGTKTITVIAVATSNGYTQGSLVLIPVSTVDNVKRSFGQVST